MYLRSGRRLHSFTEAEWKILNNNAILKYPFWLYNSNHLYTESEKLILLQFCDDVELFCTCKKHRLVCCQNGPKCRKCICDLCFGILDVNYTRVGDVYNQKKIVDVKVSCIFMNNGLK